jgi:hypothetical protein
MIKQGDVIEVELECEICCDYCMEVIHVHLEECPICKTGYPGTSMYGSPQDYINDRFNCEKCNSEFKLLSWDYPDAIVEVIKGVN